MASLSSLKSKTTSAVKSATSSVKSAASSAKTTASKAASTVKSTATSAKSTASKTASTVKSAASSAKSTASSAKTTVSKAANTVKSTTSNLTSTLKNTASAVKSTASSAKSTTTKAASAVKSTASNLTSTLKNTASTVKSTASNAKSTATKAASTIKSTASNLTSSLKNTTTTAKSTASNLTSTLKNTASNLTNTVKNATNKTGSTLSSLKTTASNIGTVVKSTVNNGTSTIKNLATKITTTNGTNSSLTNTFKTLTDTIKNNNVLSSINSAIKESKVGGIGILTNLVNKYAGKGNTGITNTFNTIKNNITSATTSIRNNVLSSLGSVFGSNSRTNISNAINALRSSLTTNTSGALSNLFNQVGSLRNNLISTVKPVNVFSGLNNIISEVKSNLQNGALGITSINTMGVLDLSTAVGGAAERIQTSFEKWKGRITDLVNGGSMTGIISQSIGEAESKMNELFSNFRGYADQMVNRLFGISGKAEEIDDGYYAPEPEEGSNVLGARDSGDLGTMSSSSGYDDGPGVAGATADLDAEYADLVQKAKDVYNGKYGVGQARKDALGDDYDAVQAIVNDYCKTGKWPETSGSSTKPNNNSNSSIKDKSAEELAKEVMNGKYGTGQARKDALGDRYDEVQNIVNQMANGTYKGSDSKTSNNGGNNTQQKPTSNGTPKPSTEDKSYVTTKWVRENYSKCQCPVYAKKRAKDDAGFDVISGNANEIVTNYTTGENASKYGTSSTPVEKSIMVIDPGTNDTPYGKVNSTYGHCLYVESINDDGTFTVSESNYDGNENLRVQTYNVSDFMGEDGQGLDGVTFVYKK